MNLFLNAINLESVERYNFVSVVYCSGREHGRNIERELRGTPKFWERSPTVKAAYDGFLTVPPFDYKLYMRVFFGDGLEAVEEEGAGVG